MSDANRPTAMRSAADEALTDAEAQALRAHLQAAADPPVDPIDIGSADRTLRKRMPGLQRHLEVFYERLRVLLARQFRGPCALQAAAPELIGPVALADLVHGWASAAELRWPQLGHAGYVGFDHVMSFILVELAYGAAVEQVSKQALTTRERLTEVERQTTAPLLHALARTLAEAMLPGIDERAAPGADAVAAFTLTPPFQLHEGTAEAAVVVRLKFALGQHTPSICFVLLPHVLEHVDETPHDAQTHVTEALAAHLEHAQVSVAAVLGTASMTLYELLHLTPGTTLWLDRAQADPLPVYVEEQVKFLAQPIVRHGALGVEIVARVA